MYLLEKTVATFGTFTLLYTVTAHAILPLTPTPEQSFFRSLLDLSLPFMVRICIAAVPYVGCADKPVLALLSIIILPHIRCVSRRGLKALLTIVFRVHMQWFRRAILVSL